ncbi:hypothetical protein REPUB_Repub11eG0161500 [Reevesia pubescens]
MRTSTKRKFCYGDSLGMDDFNEFIAANNLVDLPLVGKKFTWFDCDRKRSRLDRFLLSESLFNAFPNFIMKDLKKSLSDHLPISFQWHNPNWGPKPFQFFNWWMNKVGYEEVVSRTWSHTNSIGWVGFKLLMKLKIAKKELKNWSADT